MWNDLIEEDGSDPLSLAYAIDLMVTGYVTDEEIKLPEAELENLCKEYGII